MKIKTRLRLNSWFSLGVVICVLLSLGWSFWEADRTDQNVLLAAEIQKAAFERTILRDDWLLNREDRAKTQWYAKTETLRSLLASASRRFKSKESRELLQDTIKDFEATVSLFSATVGKDQQKTPAADKKLDFTEAETRRISQVFLKAYSLVDNISRLRELYQKKAAQAHKRGIVLMVVFVLGGIIAMAVNSIVANRLLAAHVTQLHEGLAIIGGGNLEYHIQAQGNDELADLARASNDMAARLKASYASVEDLQREIAERKLAEERIKTLSLHELSLITAIPDIIMEVDTNKIYTWANEPGLKFFGEDVIGRPADSYFIREQNIYDVVQPIFNGSDDLIYVESWQRRRDGQERLLAWWCRVLKDAEGNVTGALSSARDMTGERLAEERLRESEDKFKYMFDKSPVGRSVTFPDGRVNVNKAFSELIGYSQEEMNQHRWQDITHPDDIAATQSAMDELLSGKKESVRVIKRYIHKNGAVVWTDISSSLRRDQDGSPLYFMTTMVDITEQKQAEAQREAALEEIRKLNEELDRRVARRTAELTAKTAELERINKVFVDRELRMRELKARIAELEEQIVQREA